MDAQSAEALKELVLSRSVAALGTLRDGAPYVSLVLYAPARDLSGILIHISRLAYHTRNILMDPRISLMIAAAEHDVEDPQTLPRVSIQGVAEELPRTSAAADAAAAAYLARFPQATTYFELGDFSFFSLRPRSIRFVAGFGRAFSVTPRQLKEICTPDCEHTP
ncbi:MAG: pyridoxamine 5'-phosphate oxidase family protein [Candidatus Binatia bacterium]